MPAAPWRLSRRRFLIAAIAIWMAAASLLLWRHWPAIEARRYIDVDDLLRLVEVRDWMNGQSFFDVGQHRMNQPFGAPMHWSRLVDGPIAAVILLARPMVGAADAETVAAVIVPMLTLLAVILLVGLIARRLAGDAVALVAMPLLPGCATTVFQLQPLRVDHHGWEIAFALLAAWGVLDRDARRGGLIAAGAIAVALQISLEALPFAVAIGGVVGVRWAFAANGRGTSDRDRLLVYGIGLASCETLLFAALHGPGGWGEYCDAITPPHLLGLAVAALGVALLAYRAPARASTRLAGLIAVALAAAGAFRLGPPHCGADAFSALEPIVRLHWYDRIQEGMPVWHEDAASAIAFIGFPLVGLACNCAAVWVAPPGRRSGWACSLAMLAAATLTGADVLRACALANALAVPGAAWAIVVSVRNAARLRTLPARILAGAAAVIALGPWSVLVLAAAVPLAAAPPRDRSGCGGLPDVARLGALPPARILAPLELGPAILFETHHAVLASQHHRNHVAMAETLRAMLGTDAVAHAVVRRHALGYVAICPASAELRYDRRVAHDGFAAHLAGGEAPPWLTAVAIPGAVIRVWQVNGITGS